jgi:voltage-gated potassium channel
MINLLQTVRNNLLRVSKSVFFYGAIAHMLFCYNVFLSLPGEAHIVTSFAKYFYFWVVTSATLGYGDIAPVTVEGMLFTALVFVPFSLLLFGIFFTHLSEYSQNLTRKKYKGLGSFRKMKNHIIVAGNEEIERTIELIFADTNRESKKVLIVTDKEMEHPFPDNKMVSFCLVKSYYSKATQERIGLANACSVIVHTTDDDKSAFLAMSCQRVIGDDAHISVCITDEDKAKVLRSMDSKLEVYSPNKAHNLVKSMQDRGTNHASAELFTNGEGHTHFTSEMPSGWPVSVRDLEDLFRRADIKLLAIAKNKTSKGIDFTPALDTVLIDGSIIHYIATERKDMKEVFAKYYQGTLVA